VSHHLQPGKISEGEDGLQTPQIVASAADLTRSILYSDPDRLAHSQAAARQAELLALAVDQESALLLVAAAWLHDIGYAPGLRDTGYHPIDGARHLQSIGWPPAICNQVAHHSGARFVAAVLRLDRQLDPYPFSQDALSDALTVADQTTGPHGEAMTVEQRMSDMLRRHGPNSPNALAHPQRERYIRAAATRVADRLESRGMDRTHHQILIG
jgi:putative nucleotidyltransferase with HDIG domain